MWTVSSGADREEVAVKLDAIARSSFAFSIWKWQSMNGIVAKVTLVCDRVTAFFQSLQKQRSRLKKKPTINS